MGYSGKICTRENIRPAIRHTRGARPRTAYGQFTDFAGAFYFPSKELFLYSINCVCVWLHL